MRQPALAVVPRQFNGPNGSGNGGWVSGLVAERLADHEGTAGPVTVSLRTPPPLEVGLTWADLRDRVELRHDDTVVGEAVAGASFEDGDPPAPVTPDEAVRARDAYEGFAHHPFPRCFTCGTDRGEGDGLRIFSGPVGDGRMAAPWDPHPAFAGEGGVVTVPVLWAALDCPGGWAAGIGGSPMVLGRMTAELGTPPEPGEPCVAVGSLRRVEGRKHLTATALYGADGRLVGRAEQTWITIDIAHFS